jgi:pimeloyl-ACP methyl ester carboxylesterase
VAQDGLASIAGFVAGYVDVAGSPTWHEVGGEGPPVVLLHAAFSGAGAWSAQAPALVAAGFRVYVPERRGHGHTPDVDAPLSYSAMAEETAAYLETVVGERAHLIGWSDGAVVALLVAQYRPELVERIVLIGKYYNSSGRVSGTDLERFLRTDEGRDYLRRGYETVSPDGPEHFPVIYDKTMKMIDSEPELDLSTFASVTAPTLVLQADRDVVTLEHGAAVATALGNGRLAVLPGTHSLPVELPDVVNPLLVSFLQQSTPASP